MRLTGFLVFVLTASTCRSWTILDTTTMTSTNGANAGDWSSQRLCAGTGYLGGFRIKHDGAQSSKTFDGQSQTGFEAYCTDSTILLDEVDKGSWQGTYVCPNNERIIGLQLNVRDTESRIFVDLYGVQNTRVLCEGGTFYDGLTGLILSDDKPTSNSKIDDNNWGLIQVCNNGFMCGFQARLDGSTFVNDARGLTDITMYCCP